MFHAVGGLPKLELATSLLLSALTTAKEASPRGSARAISCRPSERPEGDAVLPGDGERRAVAGDGQVPDGRIADGDVELAVQGLPERLSGLQVHDRDFGARAEGSRRPRDQRDVEDRAFLRRIDPRGQARMADVAEPPAGSDVPAPDDPPPAHEEHGVRAELDRGRSPPVLARVHWVGRDRGRPSRLSARPRLARPERRRACGARC